MGNYQVGRVLWRKTDVKDAVGRLAYVKSKSPLLYLIWADFPCDHPKRYFEVFGPIPAAQVHSLCILATTMPLVQATLAHARRVHLSNSSIQILMHLEPIGGFPPVVSSLTVSVDLFDFVGPSKTAAALLLASLLTRSQVKSLRIKFTDSHRQSGHGSVVMEALEALLANGIPPTVKELAMGGSFDLALNHLRSLPVAWPQSLRHVDLNLGRSTKESGSLMELMLSSLASAHLPLESLKVSDTTLENGTTRDHVLACLIPSLLSFSLELSESTLDPLGAMHVVIHALSTACPALRQLQIHLAATPDSRLLDQFAAATIPHLHHLPLVHLGLCGFGLGSCARSTAVFDALAAHVPTLRLLDLSKNLGVDDVVVEMLVARFPQLRQLISVGTKVTDLAGTSLKDGNRTIGVVLL
ncbi:hypothetical protein GGF32_001149 [Allomyces javanicus]|nr:hypothetical protein GGF32_001149 [Allomyces javanicus]